MPVFITLRNFLKKKLNNVATGTKRTSTKAMRTYTNIRATGNNPTSVPKT